MKQNNFTESQLSVLDVIKEEAMTSSEILDKVDNVSMLLSLYNIMDELKIKGAVKSFTKENIKYHIAC
jgi:Fe2+ or Zn2+ uptake regulation protein